MQHTNILAKPRLQAVKYEYNEDFKLYPMAALTIMAIIYSRSSTKKERKQHY